MRLDAQCSLIILDCETIDISRLLSEHRFPNITENRERAGGLGTEPFTNAFFKWEKDNLLELYTVLMQLMRDRRNNHKYLD